MTNALRLSELAYMSTEATQSLNGIEEMSYLESYQHTTGDEQQSWHITPNSMYPSSLGGVGLDPPSSLTRYQWRELYEAWKLATALPDSHQTFRCPRKVRLFTPLTAWVASPKILKMNLLKDHIFVKELFRSIRLR